MAGSGGGAGEAKAAPGAEVQGREIALETFGFEVDSIQLQFGASGGGDRVEIARHHGGSGAEEALAGGVFTKLGGEAIGENLAAFLNPDAGETQDALPLHGVGVAGDDDVPQRGAGLEEVRVGGR